MAALGIAWLVELFGRHYPGSSASPETDNVRERLLAIALDGLRATDRGAMPGAPPSPQQYEDR